MAPERRIGTRVRIGIALACIALTLCWHAPLLFGPSPPFTYDDVPSVVEAPNVRRLWPLGAALGAPPGSGASGRPLVALSLAVDHALHGMQPRGWRATNVLIHLGAAMALYLLARAVIERVQARARERGGVGADERAARSADPSLLALALALAWAAHPLHTMAIANVVYRNESLVALFYFATLACAVRAMDGARRARWTAAAAACAVLGAASKEVIVTAPLVALLLDATLVSGSLARAWREHRGLHLALAASWIPLAAFVALGDRGASVGLAQQAVSPLEYLLTQAGVLVHYLRLAAWPAPLVLDYDGWPIARSIADVAWPAAVVLALLGAAALAAARGRLAGALGLACFLVLAPTSTVIPLTGAIAGEHRMIVPLAGLVALGGIALARVLDRAARSPRESERGARAARARAMVPGLVALALTLAWGATSIARYGDYRRELGIWQDTVEKRPDNPRAWSSLGVELAARGRQDEAEAAYRRAIELRPRYHEARINLGNLLLARGDVAQAAEHYLVAAEARPDLGAAHYYAGATQAALGRAREGAAHLARALELGLEPRLVDPCRLELAWVLATAPDPAVRDGARAVELAESAAAGSPGARALDVLAAALAEVGRLADAARTAEAALARVGPQARPGYADALRARLAAYRAGRPWREPER